MQRDFLQPLPTNAISWYELPFATKLGLLQRFLVVAQGLEVCSGPITLGPTLEGLLLGGSYPGTAPTLALDSFVAIDGH